MSYITKNHKQTIVYWGTAAKDKWGDKTFAAPVEIVGRWEDKKELFRDIAGREVVSRSIVYLGQDVVEGEYLYLGTLASIASAANPESVSNAFEIRSFTKSPNIAATDFERKVMI